MSGARGERIILAGEREVRILFTNRALADAERQMGKSVFGVARGLIGGQSGIVDVAYLLQAGMQAAKRDAGERPVAVSLDSAFQVLDEAGVTAVATAVMEAMAAVLSYDPSTSSGRGSGQDGADPNG